ncbi:hypothetical protein ACFPOE_08900 [Caenimonas terrae]|uniref:Uncharacterized protein n=1 Tax=Caenimonas terrae TaxID=696074 RepID=A0ABW0NFG2_9BURK
MPRTKPAAKKTTAKRPARKAAAAAVISAWQDDPLSGLPPIPRPVPNLAKGALKFKIKGTAIPPQVYPGGTPGFRYWTAAEALRRGGDFWAPLLGLSRWQPGAVLGVSLDKGTDLNAYYDRSELAFFHEAVGKTTYYSGESPDVVCHEMGHACLDAHRPQLWDAPFIEAGAFHESFGDMSAILSALQLPSVRAVALKPLKDYKPSPLSRCAEQLGEGIRKVDKPAVDKDCLRNAYNAFKYVDPQTLPDSAPATALSAEVHSFSRVFTGAFYEILSGMLNIRSKAPTDAVLASVATDMAYLLSDATAAAPVQPDYFAQVAAHMVDADTSRFAGKYRAALVATFVKRRILPKTAVQSLAAAPVAKAAPAAVVARAAMARRPTTQFQKVTFNAQAFGLEDKTVIVMAPVERKPFQTAAASLIHQYGGPDKVEQATHRFVKQLFAHDRVDSDSGTRKASITDSTPREQLRKTHVLTKAPGGLKLTRRLFHCGCGRPIGLRFPRATGTESNGEQEAQDQDRSSQTRRPQDAGG